MGETDNSTKLNVSGTKQAENDAISAISLGDDTVSRGKKKKRGGKSKPSSKAGNPSSTAAPTFDEKYFKLKQLIRNPREAFTEEKRGKDPYEYINKKTHKIELNSEMPYIGTSMDDVFEIRNAYNEAVGVQEENRFIKAQLPKTEHDKHMMSLLDETKKPEPVHKEWQLKTLY